MASIDKYVRTRQAMLLMILNSLESQRLVSGQGSMAELASIQGMDRTLKEYCTVRIAGPRSTGHTSAIHDLIEELEHDHRKSTIALTAVASCERLPPRDRKPDFTPMRSLDKASLAEVIFVDNAFGLAPAGESRVYAFAGECLRILGRVVVVLVQ